MKTNVFQSAILRPNRVPAGDSVEFVITLTVGAEYTRGTSRLVFDFPGMLGTSRPSLYFQEDSGYCEVYLDNPDVTCVKRLWNIALADFIDKENYSKAPLWQRMVILDLTPGLKEGDTVELHWGETGGGYGPGCKVTTVVPKKGFQNTIHTRYFEDVEKGLPDWARSFAGYCRPVPDAEVALSYEVLAREPHHCHLTRKPDKAMLIPHDRFHNVARVKDAAHFVDAPQLPEETDAGLFEFNNPRIHVVSKTLPLYETAEMENVFEGLNIYWGDLHTHSAFSNDCIEQEKQGQTPDDLMDFARHRACLDFFAVTDHHQPWDRERNKIGEGNWRRTLEAVAKHDADGRFLVWPGLEYRGPRGDTILVFGWRPRYDEIDKPHWTDIRTVWKALEGKDFLSIPHFHNPGELNEGEWWENTSGVEPVLEIFSCHGNCERAGVFENAPPMCKRSRWDRNGAHLLAKGYRYGLACNSDGHTGHVGLNGLTAAFAPSLNKDAIFDAYRQRRVYGTTNARIRLVFTGNGELMGSVAPNDPKKTLLIDAGGENRLKKIDVFRNGELYRRLMPKGKRFKQELIVDDDEPANWYVRVMQVDNHTAFSSPVWFE